MFPTTAAEFYALRDHRTNVYAGVQPEYTRRAVEVTVHPAAAHMYVGQLMLVLSVNLLSRWCRDVQLTLPTAQLDPKLGGGDLQDALLRRMQEADPFGHFTVNDGSRPADLSLHIGLEVDPDVAVPHSTTVLSSNGWLAAVRRSGDPGLPLDDADRNPLGAAAAAVLGGAQLFLDALGRDEFFDEGFLFDTFTGEPVARVMEHPSLPEHDFDLGRILMLGAGSVGSAAAYFMGLFGLRGLMSLVDADVVKVENFGRSPVFGQTTYGGPKVRAVATALQHTGLQIQPLETWWHEVPNLDVGRYDIVIPVANEHGVRELVQAGVPPLMVHASTGANWNVNFGRHIPGRDDCLLDRFAGLGPARAMACAGGQVQTSTDQTVDASLPFLSFWAGFLVAADLLRLGIAAYPHTPNFGAYSFRRNKFVGRLQVREASPSCECRRQGPAFKTLRQHTKYRSLSPEGWGCAG